jgi:hypothetical protein
VGGTGDNQVAIRADDRQADFRASHKLHHLARALVCQEKDMRIVLDKQREHGTSDVSVMLIDVHKHGDPRPLDQRAHSLSLCSQALNHIFFAIVPCCSTTTALRRVRYSRHGTACPATDGADHLEPSH